MGEWAVCRNKWDTKHLLFYCHTHITTFLKVELTRNWGSYVMNLKLPWRSSSRSADGIPAFSASPRWLAFPLFLLSSVTFFPLPPGALHQHVWQRAPACPSCLISSLLWLFLLYSLCFCLITSCTLCPLLNPPWRQWLVASLQLLHHLRRLHPLLASAMLPHLLWILVVFGASKRTNTGIYLARKDGLTWIIGSDSCGFVSRYFITSL